MLYIEPFPVLGGKNNGLITCLRELQVLLVSSLLLLRIPRGLGSLLLTLMISHQGIRENFDPVKTWRASPFPSHRNCSPCSATRSFSWITMKCLKPPRSILPIAYSPSPVLCVHFKTNGEGAEPMSSHSTTPLPRRPRYIQK